MALPEELSDLFDGRAERAFPLPARLEARVDAVFDAAGEDEAAALAGLWALEAEEPELVHILKHRLQFVAHAEWHWERGDRYDAVSDTWRRPD